MNVTTTSAGTKIWNDHDGNIHRLDGPAVIWVDGYKEWWVNGRHHRLDGPAIEWHDGRMSWYVNGIYYTDFKDFQEAGNLSDEDMMVLRLKYGEP